jgi:hypothetical protein
MFFNVLGPVLALLPERWRKTRLGGLAGVPVNWPRAALISGIVEGLVCLCALVVWYFLFIPRAAGVQAELAAGALQGRDAPAGMSGAGLSFAMGLAALTAFATHPLSWALSYFCLEGVLRACAAGLTDETCGTLPLALVDRAIAAFQRRAYEARVPLVADEVTRSDPADAGQPWDLKVAACRPKLTWKYPLTIAYEGEFFQVVGEAAKVGARPRQVGARPHVYLLRRPPRGEAYRGVEQYDPQAILGSEAPRPNFLVAPFRAQVEKWRIARLSVVADFVFTGDGSEGWHLRVESCRSKPEWTPARTIRYEGRLYRVESSCQGTPQRPFGYRLRLLPEGEVARGVLTYTPDEPLRLYGK